MLIWKGGPKVRDSCIFQKLEQSKTSQVHDIMSDLTTSRRCFLNVWPSVTAIHLSVWDMQQSTFFENKSRASKWALNLKQNFPRAVASFPVIEYLIILSIDTFRCTEWCCQFGMGGIISVWRWFQAQDLQGRPWRIALYRIPLRARAVLLKPWVWWSRRDLLGAGFQWVQELSVLSQ